MPVAPRASSPQYERQRQDAATEIDRAAAYRSGMTATMPSRRPSPFWIATLAIIASIGVAGGVLSVINFRSANDWQDRARAADRHAAEVQTQLDETNAQLDKAETELKVMAIGLEASNKDRDTLQSRIDALAGEQANADDQQPLVEQPPGDTDLLATSNP